MSKIYKNNSNDGVNLFVGGRGITNSVIDNNLNDILHDNYFFFDATNDYYIDCGTDAYDATYPSFATRRHTISFKIMVSEIDKEYVLFDKNNGTDDHYMKVWISGATNKINISNKSPSTAEEILETTNAIISVTDIDTPITISIGCLEKGLFGTYYNQFKIFKNGVLIQEITSTTPIFNFDKTNVNRYMKIGTDSYTTDWYLKEVWIYSQLLYAENLIEYHNNGVLAIQIPYSYIIYNMANQNDYDSVIYNSGTFLSAGNGTLIKTLGDYDGFYIVASYTINEKSYYKIFDTNINNNILSTKNIYKSSEDVEGIYSVPSCEYLSSRFYTYREEARTHAQSETNESFGYNINDDYYTNYMCCGTRLYVPWFFLYDARPFVDTATGGCINIEIRKSNNVNSTVAAQYGKTDGMRLWMENFQRKLTGAYRNGSQLPSDYDHSVQYSTNKKTLAKEYPLYPYTWHPNRYPIWNIVDYFYDGMDIYAHYVDVIDSEYTGHRYFDLKIYNNSIEKFTQMGSNSYTPQSGLTSTPKEFDVRLWTKVANYYNKPHNGAMRVPFGTYQILFNVNHSLKRTSEYNWNLLPFKKVVTTGYMVYVCDTTTNKYDIIKTYWNYDDSEIDMTTLPSQENPEDWYKTNISSQYTFLTLPELDSSKFYVIQPLYSNIILAGQTNLFPTHASNGDKPDTMVFNGYVPNKANIDKLIPKTNVSIQFKKIL